MRIKLTLEGQGNGICLPIHYNYLIQSVIYNNLKSSALNHLHDEGHKFGKRNFKLFTFSRLIGDFEIIDNVIKFKEKCYLYIASPLIELLESLAVKLAKEKKVKCGESYFYIDAIEVDFLSEFKSPILVKAISPITVYSTLLKREGGKKTYYYSPFEEEFSIQIKNNLIKKYNILNKEKIDDIYFEVSPHLVSKKLAYNYL